MALYKYIPVILLFSRVSGLVKVADTHAAAIPLPPKVICHVKPANPLRPNYAQPPSNNVMSVQQQIQAMQQLQLQAQWNAQNAYRTQSGFPATIIPTPAMIPQPTSIPNTTVPPVTHPTPSIPPFSQPFQPQLPPQPPLIAQPHSHQTQYMGKETSRKPPQDDEGTLLNRYFVLLTLLYTQGQTTRNYTTDRPFVLCHSRSGGCMCCSSFLTCSF